jgi:hypothetical protein
LVYVLQTQVSFIESPDKLQTIASTTSDVSTSRPQPGTWVAVAFEDRWYPGEVIRIDGLHTWVNFMVPLSCKSTHFHWPTKEDQQRLHLILFCIIPPPQPISRRAYSWPADILAKVEAELKPL